MGAPLDWISQNWFAIATLSGVAISFYTTTQLTQQSVSQLEARIERVEKIASSARERDLQILEAHLAKFEADREILRRDFELRFERVWEGIVVILEKLQALQQQPPPPHYQHR